MGSHGAVGDEPTSGGGGPYFFDSYNGKLFLPRVSAGLGGMSVADAWRPHKATGVTPPVPVRTVTLEPPLPKAKLMPNPESRARASELPLLPGKPHTGVRQGSQSRRRPSPNGPDPTITPRTPRGRSDRAPHQSKRCGGPKAVRPPPASAVGSRATLMGRPRQSEAGEYPKAVASTVCCATQRGSIAAVRRRSVAAGGAGPARMRMPPLHHVGRFRRVLLPLKAPRRA